MEAHKASRGMRNTGHSPGIHGLLDYGGVRGLGVCATWSFTAEPQPPRSPVFLAQRRLSSSSLDDTTVGQNPDASVGVLSGPIPPVLRHMFFIHV